MAVVFMQPLVLFLGNAALLGGMLALIYSDLNPQTQDAWDQKLSRLLKQVRSSLKKKSTGKTESKPPKKVARLALKKSEHLSFSQSQSEPTIVQKDPHTDDKATPSTQQSSDKS